MKKQYIVPSTCEAEMLMEAMILSGSGGVLPPHIDVNGDTFSNPSEFA